MPYQVASSAPLPASRGAWRDQTYARHGLPTSSARYWRGLGMPPTVAARLVEQANPRERTWLAATFSTHGLRRLVAPERGFTAADTLLLVTAAEANLDRTRAYLSLTDFTVREIERLVTYDIPARRARTWQDRVPLLRRGVRLPDLLHVANIVHRCPPDQVSAWVRFAVHNDIVYDQQPGGPYRFLGGDTGLFVAAGLSPAEAQRLWDAGPVDRTGLRTLAALRTAGATR